MSSPHTYDVESLFHTNTISSRREQRTYWHQILNTTLCAAIISGILLFSLNFYLRYKSLCCYSNRTILKTNTEVQTLLFLPSEPTQKTAETTDTDSKRDVMFASYAKHSVIQ
jgi:hypothetical protein